MSNAVRRREALYESVLKMAEDGPCGPVQSCKAQKDAAGFSRRNFLSLGSSAALLGLASKPSQVRLANSSPIEMWLMLNYVHGAPSGPHITTDHLHQQAMYSDANKPCH